VNRESPALDFLVIGAMPWLLVAAVPSWYYNPPQTIDPWLYHGFLRFYPEYIEHLFPSTYYGSRAAWLLPAQTVYRLLSPASANLLLHTTLLSLALFLFHAIVRRTAAAGTALLPTLMFGTYAGTLAAFGWDYPDGALIAYQLGALYCVVRWSEDSGRPRWAVSAGASYAGMVHSNILALLFAPALLVSMFAQRAGQFSPRNLAPHLAYFVAGGVGLTLVLAAWNAALGGMWVFFLPSLEFIENNISIANQGKATGLAWTLRAAWLPIPVAAFVAAITIMFNNGVVSRPARALAMFYAIAFASVALFDALYGALLQYFYYASWFVPAAFALIAYVTHLNTPSAAVSRLLVLLLYMAAVLPLYAESAVGLLAPLISRLPAAWPWSAVILLAGAYAIARSRRFAAAAVPLTGVALIALNVHFVSHGGISASNPSAPRLFGEVTEALDVIAPHLERGRPYFWFGGSSRGRPLRTAVASAFLYEFSMIGYDFPYGPHQSLRSLHLDSLVVVVSDASNVSSDAKAALASLGFSTEVVEVQRTNASHTPPHEIAILRVTRVAASQHAPGSS
jgi:hypothetical protein